VSTGRVQPLGIKDDPEAKPYTEVNSMQINHNVRAMITQHALFQNNNSMSKSLEKLSTGLKINRAQDDAAGLAMSEQMRTQIRGLGKAKQNSQDGQAALQIAEGGLQEITNLLQRQRELAVQAANDTLTSTERKYLDDEFQALTKEIGRISKSTDYNGKNMLNYDFDPNISFGAVDLGVASEYAISIGTYPGGTGTGTSTGVLNSATIVGREEGIKSVGGVSYASVVRVTVGDKTYDLTNVKFDKSTGTYTVTAAVLVNEMNKADKNFAYFVDGDNLTAVARKMGNNAELGAAWDQKIFAKDGTNVAASYTLHVGANYSGMLGATGRYANELAVTYATMTCSVTTDGKWDVRVGNALFMAHGKAALELTGQNHATLAIDEIDAAVKSISGVRAKIGTFINRLDYTVNNIANLEFNTQDAEGRIRDTDFAKETTNFTRNQIMVQASTSMLAQANSLPQAVLGLLG